MAPAGVLFMCSSRGIVSWPTRETEVGDQVHAADSENMEFRAMNDCGREQEPLDYINRLEEGQRATI